MTRKLLDKIERGQSLSDKFHTSTNTKILDSPEKLAKKIIPESWIKIYFKTYPRLDRIKLNNATVCSSKISNIMSNRRSVRQFSNIPILISELSYILSISCGIISSSKYINDSRRTYPSAGARYPLEIYPIILNCKEVKKGLYHYNIKENSLEKLLECDLKDWVLKNTSGDIWIVDASIIFIITGVLDRTRIKYGDRGYRYALLEAGHLGQNICLLATELGLGSCALGGYIDSEFDKLLDIYLQKESTLYLIAIGKL